MNGWWIIHLILFVHVNLCLSQLQCFEGKPLDRWIPLNKATSLQVCSIRLNKKGILSYGITTSSFYRQKSDEPWCEDNEEDDYEYDKGEESITINYNDPKFTDFITNEFNDPSKDNIYAFIFFHLPEDTCNKNYREDYYLNKIQRGVMYDNSMLPAEDPKCKQDNELRMGLSKEYFGDCTVLETIKEDVCKKLRKIGYPSAEKCKSGEMETISMATTTTEYSTIETLKPAPTIATPSPATTVTTESIEIAGNHNSKTTTSAENVDKPHELETTSEEPPESTTPSTPTTTTTHNPYVGNYLSEEQEAKRIRIIKEREKKSSKSVQPPARKQKVPVELILMLLLLTAMGAFSAFVILYNGNSFDREPSLSDEVSSDEED